MPPQKKENHDRGIIRCKHCKRFQFEVLGVDAKYSSRITLAFRIKCCGRLQDIVMKVSDEE